MRYVSLPALTRGSPTARALIFNAAAIPGEASIRREVFGRLSPKPQHWRRHGSCLESRGRLERFRALSNAAYGRSDNTAPERRAEWLPFEPAPSRIESPRSV